MTSERDVRGWAAGLDGVVDRIAPRFGRAEPRRRAAAFLHGLLSPVGRKNGWQLAEAAGDATPDGVQEFLSRALYVPDAWAKDEARRRQARIPDDVELVTKPKQGLAMLERARVNAARALATCAS